MSPARTREKEVPREIAEHFIISIESPIYPRGQKLNLTLSWICREVVIVSKIKPAVGFGIPTD
jgi:hypothetical protein